MAADFAANVRATAPEADLEFVIIDNRAPSRSLAQVYNEGIRRARGKYLLLAHEDLLFHTSGWWELIRPVLEREDTGTIGFAGTKAMVNACSGWGQLGEWAVMNVQQCFNDGQMMSVRVNCPEGCDFMQVVAVDGLAMFVRREVALQWPFDEEALPGFHGYDVDFSLTLHSRAGLRNYVCVSAKVVLEHFSEGSFRHEWFSTVMRLHRTKWKAMLPAHVPGVEWSDELRLLAEEHTMYSNLRKALKIKVKGRYRLFGEFLMMPMSARHLNHVLANLYNLVTYFFRKPK